MKKYLFSAAALLAMFSSVLAQTTDNFKAAPRHTIYAEMGGAGLFSSLNYEFQLTKTPQLNARIGAGFYTEEGIYLTVPVGLNYLIKLNEKSFIETGMNVTFVRPDGRLYHKTEEQKNEQFTCYSPSVGFRRHTAHNMMWRISVMPVVNTKNDVLMPWLGFSIGKRF